MRRQQPTPPFCGVFCGGRGHVNGGFQNDLYNV